MNLLKTHLNLSDLAILFVYVTSEVAWLITNRYLLAPSLLKEETVAEGMMGMRWAGGWAMCKTVMTLRLLSFQLSSLLILLFAAHTLTTVAKPDAVRCKPRVLWLIPFGGDK